MKSIIIRAIAVLILTFIFIEISLRTPNLIFTKAEVATQRYFMLMFQRINPMWSTEKKTDPFLPPFDVYANRNFQDERRLQNIYDNVRSLKNVNFMSYDFLRDEKLKDRTAFKVCLNNFGFRDCRPFSKYKKPHTKRIIVYGSYQAFGFGLDETDIYSRQLENLLNLKSKTEKFEVWNSGRYAGTGIVGLAEFKRDLQDYQPDLVIYDFGFVDSMVVDDNEFPLVSFFEKQNKTFQGTFRLINFLMSRSYALYRLWTSLALRGWPKEVGNFAQVTTEFLTIAKKNKVPVILVRQVANTLQSQFYERLLSTGHFPQTQFIDAEKVYSRENQSLTSKNSDIDDTFWLNDLTPEERSSLEKSKAFLYPELRLDSWQINSKGHSLLANEIFKSIQL